MQFAELLGAVAGRIEPQLPVQAQVEERLREGIQPEALADVAVVLHALGRLELAEIALEHDALEHGGPGGIEALGGHDALLLPFGRVARSCT